MTSHPDADDERAVPGPGAPDEVAAMADDATATMPDGDGAAAPDETSAAAPDDGVSTAATDGDRPRGATRRRVLLTVAIVLAVLVLAGAWLAFRVVQASTALTAAQGDLETIAQQAHDGDLSELRAALPQAHEHLRTARQAVDDPVYRVATVVPWVGHQLGAVRTVTVALDDVVDAAGPVLDAVDGLLGTDGGGLDLEPLVAAAPDLKIAAERVAASADAVAAIDTDGLTGKLRAPVQRVKDELGGLGPGARTVSGIAGVLPDLLGGNGPRSYLLVSLNNAELRAQGGIAGAFAELQVDGSSVHLVTQRSTADFPGQDTPVVPLTGEEEQVFGDRLGRWIQDAELTPDFPRTAELTAARWTQDTGGQVDGVVALDVPAVAEILAATGPVTTPSGVEIDADNVVATLLNDVYLTMDEGQADTFFAEVAGTLLDAVTGGGADPAALVRAVADAAGQGRVRLWSAHPEEQQQIATTAFGGAFLSGAAPDAVGVFLDNTNSGKLDYYLSTAVTVESLDCSAEQPTATVRLDLDYEPPAEVRDLPWIVIGTVPPGTPKGSVSVNVSVYAPTGADLPALGLGDGRYISGATASLAGRSTQTVTAQLTPGDKVTYTAQVPVRDGVLQVWSTPTLSSGGLQTVRCGG